MELDTRTIPSQAKLALLQTALNSISMALYKKGYVFGYLGEASQDVRDEINATAVCGAKNLWRGMGIMGLSDWQEAQIRTQKNTRRLVGSWDKRALHIAPVSRRT